MLTAATLLAAALLAAPETPDAAHPSDLPPLLVSVTAESDLAPEIVARALDEAAAIWRSANVSLVWRRTAPLVSPAGSFGLGAGPSDPDGRRMPRATAAVPVAAPPYGVGPRVTFGHQHGRAADEAMPLAWIQFDSDTDPESDIYVSYDNLIALLHVSKGVVGDIDIMPRSQRQLLLGRGLGRALAHELGHYLLASKAHTASGLMQTRRSVAELFAQHATRFDIDAAQRRRVAARVQRLVLAQRQSVAEGML